MELLQSAALSHLEWIEHGFGTRRSEISQAGLASLKQIHSGICLPASGPGCAGEGDALVSATSGIGLSVRTADCYPILLADTRTHVIAAIHAGWRGTAAGIVREVLSRMRDLYGTRPGDIVAAIGPGIGGCCYEVGEEVGRRFGLDRAGRVNLASVNRQWLLNSGVPDSQIEVMGLCTYCDPRFYSFRREKEKAGRMISYLRLL
ncbi:MAG: peptidoglycan editing factor PgeF [Terriglobales bacterium]